MMKTDKFEQHIERMKRLRDSYGAGTGQHNMLSMLIKECEEALHQQPTTSSDIEDILNMDDSTKKALKIEYVCESGMMFGGKKELSLYYYKNGNIEIEIYDGESKAFILNKKQAKVLAAWLNHHR